jgi:hypothetical protein
VVGLVVMTLAACASQSAASVYWANFNNASGTTLGTANEDGTGVMPSFITGADGPCGVAADRFHVYWGNYGVFTFKSPSIGRANLDGSGVEQTFISTGGPVVCGVAVNSQYIYWANTDFLANGTTLGRAKLDGSGITTDFISGASGPCGVAVDNMYVYWANNKTGTIGRATLDGTVIDADFITTDVGAAPCGVAVYSGHIYWTRPGRRSDGPGSTACRSSRTSSPARAVPAALPYGTATCTGATSLSRRSGAQPLTAPTWTTLSSPPAPAHAALL